MEWSVVYEKARHDNGELFFPERLTQGFLNQQLLQLGSYIFANQYMNEVIPRENQSFKPEWLRSYREIPERTYTFAFIDPAIGQERDNDFTALIVIQVDSNKDWYVRVANRYKITPSEVMNLIFRVNEEWKPMRIGIEDVAFQKALLYMAHDEMRRRGVTVPLTGVKPTPDKTKDMRILGLVPRFEWGHIYLANNLEDLKTEMLKFPRGSHDDLLDSLSYLEQIVIYPDPIRRLNEAPAPNSTEYERYFIQQLKNGKRPGREQESDDY